MKTVPEEKKTYYCKTVRNRKRINVPEQFLKGLGDYQATFLRLKIAKIINITMVLEHLPVKLSGKEKRGKGRCRKQEKKR